MTRLFDGETLLIGSHNKKKIEEISSMLAPYVSEFHNAGEMGLEEPEETGETFAENAQIKAVALAKASGMPTLSDDSGFCVEALDGSPGVYSARWAIKSEGAERDFNYAQEKVWNLIKMQPNMNASFETMLCMAWPDGECVFAHGVIKGKIVWPRRGDYGFGYDPMFVPEGYSQTFAEMGFEEKQKISHRRRAFDILIERYLKQAA